jgi:uncharacterized protein YxjI
VKEAILMIVIGRPQVDGHCWRFTPAAAGDMRGRGSRTREVRHRRESSCERSERILDGLSTIRPLTSAAPEAAAVLGELEASNRLLVQQVFKPIANEYRISVPTPGSTEEGRPLLYVKQKKMKIKEDIRFRLSPDDGDHVFMIKSKSVLEFRGRHEVLDANGAVIGMLEKDFGKSLLRSHWHVRDPSGEELLEAHEASWIIALLRRVGEIGPDWFDLLTLLPFNFALRRAGNEVGRYKRVLGTVRDRYLLELEPDLGEVDRRLVVAFTVALDALQDR